VRVGFECDTGQLCVVYRISFSVFRHHITLNNHTVVLCYIVICDGKAICSDGEYWSSVETCDCYLL